MWCSSCFWQADAWQAGLYLSGTHQAGVQFLPWNPWKARLCWQIYMSEMQTHFSQEECVSFHEVTMFWFSCHFSQWCYSCFQVCTWPLGHWTSSYCAAEAPGLQEVGCEHGAWLELHHNGARILASKVRPRFQKNDEEVGIETAEGEGEEEGYGDEF